ncbi:MAG: hypothetical protein ACPHRO_09835 [Nannocystaceae bacterium]
MSTLGTSLPAANFAPGPAITFAASVSAREPGPAPAAPVTPSSGDAAPPASTADPVPAASSSAPETAPTTLEPSPPPTEAPTEPSAAPAASPAAPSLPSNLLTGDEPDGPPDRPARPRAPTDAAGDDESDEARAARTRAYYRALYRGPEKKLSIGATARGVFTLVDGNDTATSGRLGGVSADLWFRWNYAGVGLSGQLLGGRLSVGDERTVNVSLITGGGPSIGLGRLSLIGRGFLDLNIGYDFLYMPGQSSVADGGGGDVRYAPHGPRVRLDFGLIAPSKKNTNRFHGMGASIGFQYLVGDLRANGFPPAAVLSLGFGYFGV